MKSLLNFLIAILLLLPVVGRTQQYNFRSYNVEDGLGQSQVYTICQDQRGMLWMGTRGGGISIFNGFNFKSISKKDGLVSNYINEIIEDSSGIIWIATNSGLMQFDGKKFLSVHLPGNEAIVVHDLFLDGKSQALFCGTNKGVFKVINGNASRVGANLGVNKKVVSAIYFDEDQSLWLGTNNGLFRIIDDRLIDYSEESVYMRNAITVIRKDDKGHYWFGTYGDGLYSYNGSMFYRIDPGHELYRQTVFDVYFDQDKLWIATLKNGVVQYDRKTKSFSAISDKEGLSNNHVRCIIKDLNNNFWFGTSGGGANLFLGKQFTTYDQSSGLAGNYIYSILRDSQNRLWIGNSQKGVSVLSEEGFINYSGSSGEFFNVKVKSIAEDHEGNIWLGTDGQGVYVYDGNEFTAVTELDRAYIKQIKVGPNGHIWLATAGSGIIEVSRKDKNLLIEKWTTQEGILSNRINALHFDKQNRLWYGTAEYGIGCINLDHRPIDRFNTENGLISNMVRSISEDNKGQLWIGTADAGVCSISIYDKQKSIRGVSQSSGLTSNNVYLLTTDSDGNVIVGTEKGLDFVSFNESGAITQIRHFGKLDGFTGVETCQNSVWNDANGSIWFGTIDGLSHFNPAELVANSEPPILSFTDLKVFYESYPEQDRYLVNGRQKQTLILPYHQNHLTFDFIGVNLARPAEVTYMWKLDGFDENYSPASFERSILYSNLNPGKYTFYLKAANEDGVWTEEPMKFEFEVLAPFWRTAWFIGLMIMLVLIILIVVFALSLKRVRRKAMQHQQKIQFEKDFLELQQKAIRLQMNPHFIFNAMNSIQSLIGSGQETEARYYLAKFSRLMRQILDNSRKDEISLEEEINTLENYLLIEQFCNGKRFNYQINVEENLETDFINIPPMLIQPFVENAIKHGMKGRPENSLDGLISISFKEQDGILECVIEDNGIGREKAMELKEASKETYHESTGLEVTEERLERLDIKDGIEPLEIIDLHENGKPAGTKVILRIPID